MSLFTGRTWSYTTKCYQKDPSYGTCRKVIGYYAAEKMQAGIARLKVSQDKHDFPSKKGCFRCGKSMHFANKCNIAKGKTYWKSGKEVNFAAVGKSKPQKLAVNLLQIESSSDEEYCLTINNSLAKTTFTLNNALPVEFLIDNW